MYVSLCRFRREPLRDLARIADQVHGHLCVTRSRSEMTITQRMVLMVLGHGNNGKSTFLNALLGQVVLPQDALPLTCNLTTVEAGDKDQFRQIAQDGTKKEWQDLGEEIDDPSNPRLPRQYTDDPKRWALFRAAAGRVLGHREIEPLLDVEVHSSRRSKSRNVSSNQKHRTTGNKLKLCMLVLIPKNWLR